MTAPTTTWPSSHTAPVVLVFITCIHFENKGLQDKLCEHRLRHLVKQPPYKEQTLTREPPILDQSLLDFEGLSLAAPLETDAIDSS